MPINLGRLWLMGCEFVNFLLYSVHCSYSVVPVIRSYLLAFGRERSGEKKLSLSMKIAVFLSWLLLLWQSSCWSMAFSKALIAIFCTLCQERSFWDGLFEKIAYFYWTLGHRRQPAVRFTAGSFKPCKKGAVLISHCTLVI